MRRIRVAAVGVIALSAGVLAWPGPVAASCVGPQMGVGEVPDARTTPPPADVEIGSELAVRGALFRDGCDDTSEGAGCSARPDEESAKQDVELALVQGERRWPLGAADAQPRDGATRSESDYAIAWDVVVPDDAAPGPAVLEAGGGVAGGGAELEVVLVAG